MSFQHDEDRFRRFVAHIDRFPPHYRSVMRASALPMAQRLDTLRRATERNPHFFFAWWFYGEEQFHRGPLSGHWRREARESFIRATELSPAFAPGWEHLAWLSTAEGDSAQAQRALDQWAQAMGGDPRDTFSLVLRSLVETGFAWRFNPAARAQEVTRRAFMRPEIYLYSQIAAGPRMMPTFDAPRGAVWLGGQFAEMTDRPHMARSGLLAQAFGYLALGRPDSAQAKLDELLTRFPEAELVQFAAEFMGTAAHLDPDGVPATALSPRAASVLEVLTGGAEGGPGELGVLLQALTRARAGRWRDAVARTDSLAADPGRRFNTLVLRALLHFARADWFARLGDPDAVRRELRWSEHWEVVGFPSGAPQAADVDWSLRTLARWRLATLLDAAGSDDQEVCLAYTRVADAWAGGSPVFRARADSARRRAARLTSCAAGA
jgi:tetratricopeptide (TPR) repeat protein